MTPPKLPEAALDLLARQDHVVTTTQLRAAGVTTETVRWHTGRTWRVILPRVVLLSRETPTDRQRTIGALLWAGPKAYLTAANAAEHHGIRSAARRDGMVEMLTPHPYATRSKGYASVRRTELEDHDIRTLGPIRVASPAHSAITAAAQARRDSLREAILIEAVQRDIASVDDLAEWAYRMRPADTARLEPALAAAAAGVWSVPEGMLLDLVRTSSVLSEPLTNPTLLGSARTRLVTPDLWFDDVALAVMVHSHEYHSQGDQWVETVERDGDLTAEKIVVLGVTPTSLRRRPEDVLARIEKCYRAAASRPRPDVVVDHGALR
jgi:hypothetical protein